MTILVTAVRGLMHGEAMAGDVGMVLLWSALLVAVLGPLTVRRYGNRSRGRTTLPPTPRRLGAGP
ncbi:hypothetical protein [Blastococcus goldschmidtiae]|uniref:Uncharacterized protein n=1 Tax=Blastococcus goldschmidtiae TaxID=3075546 RepID=A0ABU2KD08_9ACTN|nr:hypothetical protein [Blastococcus sp. DSM 46792]MDT0278053.1 hypothetical protein [Blastococcus sp. DSM 46792]